MDFPFQEVEKLTFRMNSIQKKRGVLQAAPVEGKVEPLTSWHQSGVAGNFAPRGGRRWRDAHLIGLLPAAV